MMFTPGDVANPRYDSVFILVSGNKILSRIAQPGEPFLRDELPQRSLQTERAHFIGEYQQQNCFVVAVREPLSLMSEACYWPSLRELLGEISNEHFQMLGRALQIARWYREHRYCGVCGGLTSSLGRERALVCEDCEQRYFPRISPCVICLVTRGEQLLLARHARAHQPMFTTLAGFVEPGETAEQAVHREILEEVSIEVKNLRYFCSQPWPFPGQLMLGFTAEYASGDIQVDGVEVVEAHWFDVGDLPLVPPASTISAQLIRSFVEQNGKTLQ